VWGGNWLPGLVALFYVGVLAAWFVTTAGAPEILLLIVGFVALAFPVYLFLTMVYNPDAIISLNNSSARINYFLEDVLFPKRVRREVLDLFKGSLRGREIVEFGSGVGTFTMHLAEEVGPQGRVTAIDLSRVNLDILARRIAQRGHKHVRLIHDEHQVNRLHPDITRADAIYSVGFLGYVQDLRKVLREMHRILAPGGKICFVEYTNFFKILPDPATVANQEELLRSFREAGFSVTITRRGGLLWNYLIIHGIKADGKAPYV
jgi:SAM-dependent methyltransferase